MTPTSLTAKDAKVREGKPPWNKNDCLHRSRCKTDYGVAATNYIFDREGRKGTRRKARKKNNKQIILP
jgi:hypothetical protein